MKTIQLTDENARLLMLILRESEMAVADGVMPPEDRQDHLFAYQVRALMHIVAAQTGLRMPPPL